MNARTKELPGMVLDDNSIHLPLPDDYIADEYIYRNFPKFSDRQVWANSADPDQTAPSLIRVYTVCRSVCTHYSMVEPHSSHFRVITTNSLGVRIFRKFTVFLEVRRMKISIPVALCG